VVKLARAAGVLAALTLTSRVAGFVREMALAHVFGATGSTDAYLVGLTLPVAFAALAGAALHTAFIPVLAEVAEERGHEAASRLASNVINITFMIAMAVFIVGEVGAEPITRLVAPGLEGETFRRALDLTRYLLPMIVFQSLSWLLAGVLQTDGEFGLPALATVVYNLVLIFSIVLLGPRFGISAVGVGTVAAVIAQAGLQVGGLRRRGFRWLPVLDWRDPEVLKLGRLVMPVMIGAGAVELARVADKVIASHLWEGTISALSYATRLTALPVGVFGVAIATVLYPTLARLAAAREEEVLAPMAVGLLLLREPVVRLAFERGAFDQAATSATALAVLFFAPVVMTMGLESLLIKGFHSFQDTRTPALILVVVSAFGVGLKIALAPLLQHGGLALSWSLSGLLTVLLMAYLLKQRFKRLDVRSVLNSFWRVALAASVMAGVVVGSTPLVVGLLPGEGVMAQITRLGTISLTGAAAYLISAAILRVPEMQLAVDTALAAVRRLRPGG